MTLEKLLDIIMPSEMFQIFSYKKGKSVFVGTQNDNGSYLALKPYLKKKVKVITELNGKLHIVLN